MVNLIQSDMQVFVNCSLATFLYISSLALLIMEVNEEV